MTRIVKLCEATHDVGVRAVWWRNLNNNDVLVEWYTSASGRQLAASERKATFVFKWHPEVLTRIRRFGWTLTKTYSPCPKRKEA